MRAAFKNCIKKKRLANHFYMHVRNPGKRITGSNELRRHNFKKGEDRANHNSSLASDTRTLTVKGKDNGLQKIKRVANKFLSTARWHLYNFDTIPFSEHILLGEKIISYKYKMYS